MIVNIYRKGRSEVPYDLRYKENSGRKRPLSD